MRRLLGWCLVAGLACYWGAITSTRTRTVWADERALWAEAVDISPLWPRAWVNLGNVDATRGAEGLAVASYQRAIAVSLDRSVDRTDYARTMGLGFAEGNWAVLKFNAGDRAGAIALTESVLARHPTPTAVAAFHTWLVTRR